LLREVVEIKTIKTIAGRSPTWRSKSTCWNGPRTKATKNGQHATTVNCQWSTTALFYRFPL